jgi:predicted SnoaL-like aldol condensation-catalyzing enzyme
MDDHGPGPVASTFGYDRGLSHPPEFQFRVVRAFEDHGEIFVHAAHTPIGEGAGWVTMSLMSSRPECLVKIKHQVTMCVDVKVNPDKTMVAGSRELDDFVATERNKGQVRALFDTVMIGRQLDQLDQFVDRDRFVSHHPDLKPEIADFLRYLERLLLGPGALTFDKIHDVVGQGNFVAVFSTVTWQGQTYRTCDLFRLDDGVIVEHWDIFEEERHLATASNDRGKA